MRQNRVGIVGFGPVGSILGAYLVRSGMQVYGVELDETRAEQVSRNGLLIRGFAELDEKPDACFTKLADLSEIKDLSAVFICTKTWALPKVMREFSELEWPDDMRVVAATNGIGPEDLIGDFIPKERVCRAVINYAGNIDAERNDEDELVSPAEPARPGHGEGIGADERGRRDSFSGGSGDPLRGPF